MLARTMRCRLCAASLLVGLGVITAACGPSTPNSPARGITSPTLTPSPSPTATITTIAPTATPTAVAIAGCPASTSNYVYYENPPGPLPTTIPLPSGTFVENIGQGIQAGSAEYSFCTPGATPAAVTAYMNSALPAAGWMRNSVPACDQAHGYPWYKGTYGMAIHVGVNPSLPHVWALEMCPHVGED